jgi:starch synthase
MSTPSTREVVPVALVHHANQYLITDAYSDREGISQIVEGYTRLLLLHERYRLPLNLHLSGTLMETLAWHCPWFFELVGAMRGQGLLTLIGGTYAENVMTLFEPSFNVHQLNEHLWLYRQHLGCSPTEVTLCWVPERVWNTARLAEVLTCDLLANGGYRAVLLDDRLLYPMHGAYSGSQRAFFDAAGPYPGVPPISPSPWQEARTHLRVETCRAYRVANAANLMMIPLSAHLRYWIPPASQDHWQSLETAVRHLACQQADDVLLVYADDLEKAAGVGGWDARALQRYEAFLHWVASRTDCRAIHLANWLERCPARTQRVVEEGCFFEIAQERHAGENYQGWAADPAWFPYQRWLDGAQDALHIAQQAEADPALVELARKHVMACTYETAWHDVVDGQVVPAAWAKALASHARAVHVILAAARWFAQSKRPMSAEIVDIDEDGCEEVVLRSATMYAVLSPAQGARIVYLFALTPRGAVLIIGNPTDDWNLQQELNAYMQSPPNHPGALADRGFERDAYRVAALGSFSGVKMVNVQVGSDLYGACKRVCVLPQSQSLAVCYHLPNSLTSLDTVVCFSPDYYRLLREGSAHVRCLVQDTWRGFSLDGTAAWVGRPDDEKIRWVHPAQAEVGHGMNVQVRLGRSHVHLLIGCGHVNDDLCQELFHQGRGLLDS